MSKSVNLDEKKTKILLVSIDVFLRYGLSHTTMNDIAKAVGISRPALYTYFSNKEDIFNECVEYFTKNNFGNIRSNIHKYKTLEEKIYYACKEWLLPGYQSLAKHPNSVDMTSLSLPAVQKMYDDFKDLIIEIISNEKLDSKLKFKFEDYAQVLTFSLRGFKDSVKTEEELFNMIKVLVSLFVSSIEK